MQGDDDLSPNAPQTEIEDAVRRPAGTATDSP
jgi:hypothetical protein